MSNLRNKLIRLAHAKPELRSHLLPLLKEARGVGSYTAVVTGTWFDVEVTGKSISEIAKGIEETIYENGSYQTTGFSRCVWQRPKVGKDRNGETVIEADYYAYDGNGNKSKEYMAIALYQGVSGQSTNDQATPKDLSELKQAIVNVAT